jgi:chorismate mutase / prephenate dehydratase
MSSPGDDDLGGIRAAIDAIDDEILGLLNRRARLAERVAELKQAAGAETYVPRREREIIDRLQGSNPGPFPDAGIRPVFQEIISACLNLQKGVRVGYLGPEATFTHQAVKRHFGTSALTIPCGSIPAVFGEVERGEADFGVVPVENSSEGIVTHTLDSFLDSSLKICAEIVVSVDHCLLVRPGVVEGDIERVYSHPQALAQCKNWLRQNLARATLVESASTADAARAAHGDVHGAAVASELAGRLYGLAALRQRIQDVSDNVTRFLVVAGADEAEPAQPASGVEYKTSILLVLPDQAGALFAALEPLSKSGINLTKIESRPSRKKSWDYVFFLDLDGHRSDPSVAPVLSELERACALFKVLGSYRKADPK